MTCGNVRIMSQLYFINISLSLDTTIIKNSTASIIIINVQLVRIKNKIPLRAT